MDPLQPAEPPSSEQGRHESMLLIDGRASDLGLSLGTMQEVDTSPSTDPPYNSAPQPLASVAYPVLMRDNAPSWGWNQWTHVDMTSFYILCHDCCSEIDPAGAHTAMFGMVGLLARCFIFHVAVTFDLVHPAGL